MKIFVCEFTESCKLYDDCSLWAGFHEVCVIRNTNLRPETLAVVATKGWGYGKWQTMSPNWEMRISEDVQDKAKKLPALHRIFRGINRWLADHR